MTDKTRALGDWIWTIVGFLGVACIAIALYLLIFGSGGRDSTGASERARELHEAGREKLSAGDTEGAIRDLARAERIALQNPDEFEADWRETLQKDIRAAVFARAEESWSAGVAKLKEGNAASAIEDLERAVGLTRKRNPVYLNDYGEALEGLGEKDRARNAWLAAMFLSPIFPKPYHNLARWNETAGNLERALSLYRAALALYGEPGLPEGLEEKVAGLHSKLGPAIQAETERLRGNFRANPADWAAFNHLVLRQLRETRVSEDAAPAEGLRVALLGVGGGIDDLEALKTRQESAVRDRADSVVDRAGLGTVLLFLGEFERAQAVFTEARALSDSDPLSLLGSVLSGLLIGNQDDDLSRKVAERFTGNQIAWIALGAGLVTKGESDLSVRALLSGLRVDAGMAEVYRLLGLAFAGEEHAKNREGVLRAYRRIP